jgi:flavin-dependent dehydrogenase
MQYDVVIIGAGVAGMAAASVLSRKGLTVALVDRGQAEGTKTGECLMADALPIMARLGLDRDFLAAEHTSLQSYRVTWGQSKPYERHLLTHPSGAGWIVNRSNFDTILLDRCYDHKVRVYWQCTLASVQPQLNGAWQLSFTNVDMADIEAKFVIDASGRARAFTKQLGIKSQQLDKMVASCCHIENTNQDFSGIAHIASDVNGWWYYAKYSNSRGSLCYFSDSDLGLPTTPEALLKQAQKQAPLTAFVTQSKPVLNTFKRCPAYTSALQQCIGDNWLAIGDAAASFDPLSSYGMTSALSGAFYASQAVLRYFKGDLDYLQVYQALIQRNYLRYLVNREQEYSKVPADQSLFWQRRHSRHHSIHVFNTVNSGVIER